MNNEGPQLETLVHRLAECPPEFLEPPRHGDSGSIDVAAIVGDHFRRLRQGPLAGETVQCVKAVRGFGKKRQQLIAIIAWLLDDLWFLERPELEPQICRLVLADRLRALCDTVRPETMVADPDRREELVRLCLGEMGFRPRGETIAQAADRLTTLDSVERDRVLRKTRDAEARARKIREQMAQAAAQEAAARYSPE